MDYATRKNQTSRAENGDFLLATFRDDRKEIVEALKPLVRGNLQLQKNVSYGNWCKAIKGDSVWEPLAELIDELTEKAFEHPSQYCTPPEIPDEWDTFRDVARDYAPSPWWFDTLKPECSASSWQSQLARAAKPRHWESTREKAREWRTQVVECLERWEYRIQEQKHVLQVMQYRIKDMMLAGDHEKDHGVLFDEFLRLYLLSKGEFEKVPFDPANPTDRPFIMFGDDQSDWVFDRIDPWQPHHYEKLIAKARVQFDNLLAGQFADYRSPVEPDVQTQRSQCVEGMGNHQYETWDALIEYENTAEWNPVLREHEWTRTPVRVRVPYLRPEPGEKIKRRRLKYYSGTYADDIVAPEGFIIEQIVQVIRGAERGNNEVRGYREFCWRWRDWHRDEDLTMCEVRDRVLVAGYVSEQAGGGGFCDEKFIDQPFEPHKDMVVDFDYTRE